MRAAILDGYAVTPSSSSTNRASSRSAARRLTPGEQVKQDSAVTDRLPAELQRYYDERHTIDASLAVPPRNPYPYDRYEAAHLGLSMLLPPGAAVLELGAGNGDIYARLRADGMKFSEYVLSEVAQPRLEALRKLAEADPAARVIEINAEHVPAEIGTFDAVVMVALIEHLLDPIESLRAVREVLRPEGFVWIDTPNIARLTRRIKLLLGRFPSTASANEGLTTHRGEPAKLYDEGHFHYWTFRSLELMLTRYCGYSHVRRMPYSARPFLNGRLGAILAGKLPTLVSEICVAAYR
jgi:SAM-dependent methyltransferase